MFLYVTCSDPKGASTDGQGGVGAFAYGPDDGSTSMTTTIKYHAVVYTPQTTPPPKIGIAYDRNTNAAANASLGGNHGYPTGHPQGGSASASANARSLHPKGGPISRGFDDVSDPSDDTSSRQYAYSTPFFEFAPSWMRSEEGSDGWFAAYDCESVTLSASASYSSGLPPAPAGQTNPRMENDSSSGSAYESYSRLRGYIPAGPNP